MTYTDREKLNLNHEQKHFLNRARQHAYLDEKYPPTNSSDKSNRLRRYRQFMQEAYANGIHSQSTLLLGDMYEEGREWARQTLREEEEKAG